MNDEPLLPHMHYDGPMPERPKPPGVVRVMDGDPMDGSHGLIKWLAFWIVAISIILGAVVGARGDTVVAFGAEWCGPCREMRPIEADLVREGYDVRYVDYDKSPVMVKAYKVGPIPCFVAVKKTDRGWVETGRIVGKCTAGQLRRLAVVPKVAETGAAARNCVRALFSPVPLLEW